MERCTVTTDEELASFMGQRCQPKDAITIRDRKDEPGTENLRKPEEKGKKEGRPR